MTDQSEKVKQIIRRVRAEKRFDNDDDRALLEAVMTDKEMLKLVHGPDSLPTVLAFHALIGDAVWYDDLAQ